MRRDARESLKRRALAPVFRWGYQRKVELMSAIMHGCCTRDEALKAHGITAEEIESWWRAYFAGGAAGLKQLECRPRRRTAQ